MCIQGIVRGGVGRTALLRTTHGIRGGAIARACSQSAIDITVLGERPHASALEQQAIREHTSVRRVQYESSNTSNVSTPPPAEQRLQLITASDPLWSSPHTDGLPFPEPWWAFLWPGGYGTTQFVFDHQTNGGLVRSKRVLDMGSGCGSVALAAAAGGATSVLANDIDQWAGAALAVNAELSNVGLDNIRFSTHNFLNWDDPAGLQQSAETLASCFDVVIAGDLMYDQDIGPRVLKLLSHSIHLSRTGQKEPLRVFVGDPGRYVLTELGIDAAPESSSGPRTMKSDEFEPAAAHVRHPLTLDGIELASLALVARYPTPASFHAEHNGIRHANVWEMLPIPNTNT